MRVAVTPSDGTLSGTAVADQETVATSAMTVYASDAFSRTSTNTWASAAAVAPTPCRARPPTTT